MTTDMADWLLDHLRHQTQTLEKLDRPYPGEQRQGFAHN
jgi:hypothetical protein